MYNQVTGASDWLHLFYTLDIFVWHLVATKLFMHSLQGMRLLYLAAPFYIKVLLHESHCINQDVYMRGVHTWMTWNAM